MPGRNHTVEAGFMDALPASYRDAGADLLHFYRLSQLLDMRQNTVYPEMQTRFKLMPIQWTEILDAVILTKVSYFDVSTQMSPKHINKLLEIAAFALHHPNAPLAELYQLVEKDYPFFADWLKNLQEVRKEFVKHAKAQGLL